MGVFDPWEQNGFNPRDKGLSVHSSPKTRSGLSKASVSITEVTEI